MAEQVNSEILNRKNILYSLYIDCWTDIDLLNASGVRMANEAQRFLMKRPKELFDIYQERIKRFTYQSIMGQIIGWYIGALWRRKPDIEIKGTTDKWYHDTFLSNATRTKFKSTFNELWQDVFRDIVLYKYSWILTDKPRPNGLVESRLDEKLQHLDEPYLVRYDPRQVINWESDDYGNLVWAIVKTERTEQKFLDDIVIINRWYYFDRTDYRVYESKMTKRVSSEGVVQLYDTYGNRLDSGKVFAELTEQGKHALANAKNPDGSVGRVPLQIVEVEDELWLANRIYLQLKDHINQENSYVWALFMANLAMPVVIGQPNLNTLNLSETGFLHLPEPNAKFEWTEPKGTSFAASAVRLDRLREEIYRTAYLQAQGRSATAMAAGASGYSKEMDMMPANDVLNSYGDKIIAGMQDVFKNVVAARGDDDGKVSMDVSGFHFETRPAVETISQYQIMDVSGVFLYSDTLRRTMLKRLANDVLEDQNDDLKQVVAEEIESADVPVNPQDMAMQAQLQNNFQQTFQRVSDKNTAREEEAVVQGG